MLHSACFCVPSVLLVCQRGFCLVYKGRLLSSNLFAVKLSFYVHGAWPGMHSAFLLESFHPCTSLDGVVVSVPSCLDDLNFPLTLDVHLENLWRLPNLRRHDSDASPKPVKPMGFLKPMLDGKMVLAEPWRSGRTMQKSQR